MGKQAKRKAVFAPCRFLWKDESSISLLAAAVDCTMDCGSCGWNPDEQRRRLETGRMVEDGGRQKLLFPRYAR